MDRPEPGIAVLGASGLIGGAVADHLLARSYRVVPIARRFTPAQAAAYAGIGVERPIVGLDAQALAELFAAEAIDIVVNCIGVLQDGARGGTDEVHRRFTARLLEALALLADPVLLVHVSIPGRPGDDATAFSLSKRDAERLIAAAPLPSVVLRPGFVVAPAAYGGSALIRALAALPARLPARLGDRPFAATDIGDIARTIVFVAEDWRQGGRRSRVVWDVMERRPSNVGAVVEAFRHRFGGPRPILSLPAWPLEAATRLADAAARLGWAPPVRGTAFREMLRGIAGEPEPWIAATGIEPASLAESLARLPATVQERWFARLYLAKALILGSLSLFWVASGSIALFGAFGAATAILTAHGFAPNVAKAVAVVSSLADIAIGLSIAVRRTCGIGLGLGIGLSLLYVGSATLVTPELWLDPLGPLVKTGPAIVLMLVALAMLPDR